MMFRKLTDRISSAASSAVAAIHSSAGSGSSSSNSEEENEKVQRLTALGFDSHMAVQALQATQGNVDQAAELLFVQHTPSTSSSSSAPVAQQQQQQHRSAAAAQEEEQLQRAMQESYDLAAAAAAPRAKPRTAAMHKAAEAAARRAGGSNNPIDVDTPSSKNSSKPRAVAAATAAAAATGVGAKALAIHHPQVKIIPKLQDKSKEEQVLRCTDRLKTSPTAVDTLLRALMAVQKEPQNAKFRTVDKTSIGYQRSIANAPGAQDLLLAMNYRHASQKAHHDALILDLARVDAALLFLGISALEQTKLTVEYKQAKRRFEFARQISQIRASANDDTAEALKRAAYLSKCPTEPPEGRGAWMQVVLGSSASAGATTTTTTPPSSGGLPLVKKNNNNNNNNNLNIGAAPTTATIEILRRRFDGDDTLQDVLHWLGAHGSLILDKLQSREWILRDLNRGYPLVGMDLATQGPCTLQYIGCWPSGRLDIVPNDDY
jgi:UBA/TS-N domain/PUB domain